MISVIVPIYNVEKYLKECIDSIIKQTYKDIEIILVDDGSPDRCSELCDNYALQDSRIKVVHKKNGGLSSARNAGIDIASGEWLVFIDSDDYIHSEMLTKMMEAQIATDASLVVCDFCSFSDSGKAVRRTSNNGEITVYSPYEACEAFFSRKGIGWNAWNKLYHRTLFDTIRFPEGIYCEDKATIYKLYLKSNKVVYVHECLYYYRLRQGSIMQDKPLRLYYDTLKINETICNDMRHENDRLYNAACAYAAKCALYYFFSNINNDKMKDINNICLNQLKMYYPNVKKVSFIGVPEKTVVYICGKLAVKDENNLLLRLLAKFYNLIRRR